MSTNRFTPAIRATALTALCLIVYATGLTSQGLVNWQESTRALVAREMQRSGEYFAPTLRGEPYIAKPPLIYWAQIALATLMGQQVDEWHLRAVVALAGTLGVLATYFVARRMFRDGLDPPDPAFAERAAWWSALGLAVALLYVRSSRTGELDILLAPFVVVAIGAFHAAWRHAAETGRTHFGAVALAAACAVGTALVKGPPGFACVAVVVLIAPALWVAGGHESSRHARAAGAIAGTLAFVAGSIAMHGLSAGALPGLALIGLMGAATGFALGAIATPGALIAWFRILARTHPVAVIGAPLLALWGWGLLLERRFGQALIEELASREVRENLNLLIPGSAVENLGFMLYGAAPVMIAAIGALVLIVRQRPGRDRAVCTLIAWMLGGFILYSVAGKGVARYLTPVWPACALLGGWFIALAIGRMTVASSRTRLSVALMIVALPFAGAQAWWYGDGRDDHNDEYSPRTLARELSAMDPPSIATWQFDAPALDLYLDRAVPPIATRRNRSAAPLAAHIATHGPVMLLVREQTPKVVDEYGSAFDAWAAEGLVHRPIEVVSLYIREPGRTRILVFEVTSPEIGFLTPVSPVR